MTNNNTIEKTGKSIDEAIESALKVMSATRDEVEVNILDVGSKGFLGIGAKPAKVAVTKKFDPVRTANTLLREMFAIMSISVNMDIQLKDKLLQINLSGQDAGVLIGKHGQSMDALQYIINLIINKGNAAFINVSLDIENYRKRRKETLETLAQNLAKKVKATKRSVKLEPMSSYERRIIHSVLQNDKAISTHSEGDEPYRNVVISLKRH